MLRYEKTEKAIARIDHDIAALGVAKKYLKNHSKDIESHVVALNKERQGLVDELCHEDYRSYQALRDWMEEQDIPGRALDAEAQQQLLEQIRECFGRKAPVPGKASHGLNAWLRMLNIQAQWQEVGEGEWAQLTVTGFGQYRLLDDEEY